MRPGAILSRPTTRSNGSRLCGKRHEIWDVPSTSWRTISTESSGSSESDRWWRRLEHRLAKRARASLSICVGPRARKTQRVWSLIGLPPQAPPETFKRDARASVGQQRTGPRELYFRQLDQTGVSPPWCEPASRVHDYHSKRLRFLRRSARTTIVHPTENNSNRCNCNLCSILAHKAVHHPCLPVSGFSQSALVKAQCL